MTGTLHVHLAKHLMLDPVERAAVASIRALPGVGATGPVAEGRREVVIPSGGAPPLRLNLDPGRYLVEATLPSGDLVSDEVEISDGQDSSLELRSADSPHEWLSWQQFLGKVESAERYRLDPGAPFEPSVRWVTNPVPPLRGGPSGHGAWTLLADARSTLGTTAPLRPFQGDATTRLYQVTANGAWDEWALPPDPPDHPLSLAPRRYLVVQHDRSTHLVCLPVPWSSLRTDNELPVQVTVRRRPADDAIGITVTVRDPQIGAALGFMTLGALPTAQRLFDEARHMVLRKQTNPLGAAGAGYVLLGTERGREPKDWHDWIANLRNWYDWLPDGAIQHGWLRLRHRRATDHLDEAREALFTAYRRGLPFYSVGLKWLMDGLAMFAHRDRQAAEMLRRVRRVARRTDFHEPFTIVRLPLS